MKQRRGVKRRHSREDSLTDLEFEELIDESYKLDRIKALETRFILLVLGRLGLRRGELTHLKEEWIDWRKRRIDIPVMEECNKGRNGGKCGHCKQMARQKADHNEELSYSDAIQRRWEPKTEMAIRSIPFGFSGRVEIVIEEYMDEFDQWMYTANAINRRVNKVSENTEGDVYPHSLRATAANYHAGRGLDTLSLQSMMGWSDPSTARNYIAQNAENLDRNLFIKHS